MKSLKQNKTSLCILVLGINDVLNIILLWWLSVPVGTCLQLVSMKIVVFVSVFYLVHCNGKMVVRSDPAARDSRPIIGILSQEQDYRLKEKYATENYTSYIAASYVKDVEASGARVVPIMIGKDRSYYRDLMGKLNGVLLPGGATYFNQSNGYADAGQHIYEIAKELNDAGDYFPVFGTCLGFELLIVLASGRDSEIRDKCDAFGNWPITFTSDFRQSKMFQDIDEDLVNLLENQNITINAHKFCILDKDLKSHGLTVDWRVTSHSVDKGSMIYIASMEHKRYPIYGVQFHPEKSPFEWKLAKKYAHSQNAIISNRYFMNFFVQECRKNIHSFKNENEENEYLIYNYTPFFTGSHGSSFVQCYFFEPKGINSKL